MDSKHRIEVPLRSGGKKMKKRKELDALIAHSVNKKNNRRTSNAGSHSQDKLLSVSTDDPEDYEWSTVKSSRRRRSRICLYLRLCGPIFFVIGSFLIIVTMYWLYFNIRQEIYDCRQKVEEVSAGSKNIPDAMQKWHEASTYLLRNQTAVVSKMAELQKLVQSLQLNFTNLETTINVQQNYAKDEKIVADFGAKIEAIATDVESMKDHYNGCIDMQGKMQNELSQLKANLETLTKNQSTEGVNLNYSKELNDATTALNKNLNILELHISLMNDTFTQKVDTLRQILAAHNVKLEDLLDRSQNTTSRVNTIVNSLPEFRQRMSSIETEFNQIENEINNSKKMYKNIGKAIDKLSGIHQNKSMEIINSKQLNETISSNHKLPDDSTQTIRITAQNPNNKTN